MKSHAVCEKFIAQPELMKRGFVTVTEAALAAQVHPNTIWQWIREGKVPAYGRHGCTRVLLCEVMPKYVPIERPDVAARFQRRRSGASSLAKRKQPDTVPDSSIVAPNPTLDSVPAGVTRDLVPLSDSTQVLSDDSVDAIMTPITTTDTPPTNDRDTSE